VVWVFMVLVFGKVFEPRITRIERITRMRDSRVVGFYLGELWLVGWWFFETRIGTNLGTNCTDEWVGDFGFVFG